MTLTVDEVRNIRFPMARQPNEDGYRASAVDNFIDRLEVSYAEIVDENQRLKSAGGGGNDEALRSQLAAITKERDDLSARVSDLSSQLAAAPAGDQGQMAALRAQIDDLNRSNQDLRNQLAAAAAASSGDSSGQLAAANQRLAESGQQVLLLNQQLTQISQEKSALQTQVNVLEGQVSDLVAKLAAKPVEPVSSGSDTRQIVVTTSSEAAPAVVLLVEQTLAQVQTLMDNAQTEIEQRRSEAESEARRLVESATAQSQELSRRAQGEADTMRADASSTADRLISEARTRAASIDAEADMRRTQLSMQLEKERETLSDRIGQLRDFESQYRSSMVSHLQRHLDSLREAEFVPNERPELLGTTLGSTMGASMPGSATTPTSGTAMRSAFGGIG